MPAQQLQQQLTVRGKAAVTDDLYGQVVKSLQEGCGTAGLIQEIGQWAQPGEDGKEDPPCLGQAAQRLAFAAHEEISGGILRRDGRRWLRLEEGRAVVDGPVAALQHHAGAQPGKEPIHGSGQTLLVAGHRLVDGGKGLPDLVGQQPARGKAHAGCHQAVGLVGCIAGQQAQVFCHQPGGPFQGMAAWCREIMAVAGGLVQQSPAGLLQPESLRKAPSQVSHKHGLCLLPHGLGMRQGGEDLLMAVIQQRPTQGQ